MSVAVLLVGNIRTWKDTRDSFENMFKFLNCDIFVSTYSLQYGYHPFIQGKYEFKSDNILSSLDIEDMFTGLNLCGLDIEDFYCADVDEFHPQFKNIDSNHYGQVRKISKALDLVKLHESAFNKKYDTIFKTRFDILYNDIPIVDWNPKTDVMIDSSNLYPNDWLIGTSRDNMFSLSEFMNMEFYNPVYPDSHMQPPHRLLHNAFKYRNLNVKSYPIANCLLRQSGIKQYY